MKKARKIRLLSAFAITCMVISPIKANAAVTFKDTATLYPSKDTEYNNDLKKYISRNQQSNAFLDMDIHPSGLKSSNRKVAEQGLAVKKYGMTYRYLKLKKAGKTTITVKGDGSGRKYSLTVRKYVNPFSSLTMNGTKIAASFNKRSVKTYSYAKYKGKYVKIQYANKNKWTSNSCQVRIPGSYSTLRFYSGDSIKISKKGTALWFFATNYSTNQTESCLIVFK